MYYSSCTLTRLPIHSVWWGPGWGTEYGYTSATLHSTWRELGKAFGFCQAYIIQFYLSTHSTKVLLLYNFLLIFLEEYRNPQKTQLNFRNEK